MLSGTPADSAEPAEAAWRGGSREGRLDCSGGKISTKTRSLIGIKAESGSERGLAKSASDPIGAFVELKLIFEDEPNAGTSWQRAKLSGSARFGGAHVCNPSFPASDLLIRFCG